MIERRSCPIGSRMANRTILRERCRNVIRDVRIAGARRALPFVQVAPVAGRGAQREVVVHVAGYAGRRRRRNMQSGQGKSGRGVVKRRGGKADRRVAIGAVRYGE